MARSSTYIAVLRGINVGGKHKLRMKQLVALFEELGAREVRTYIQSGNVIYGATASQAKTLPKRAAQALEAELGFAVPVIGRSASHWRELVANNPFVDETDDLKQLHLALLDRKPTAAKADQLDPQRSPGDHYRLRGREIYMWCPKGLARTKLSGAYFERTLGCVCTMRNWRTTTKLLELTGS